MSVWGRIGYGKSVGFLNYCDVRSLGQVEKDVGKVYGKILMPRAFFAQNT